MAIQDIIDAFRSTFRDFTVDGVSASGKHKVKKSDARDLGVIIADAVDGTAAGNVRAETWTALAAIAGTRNGQPGEVPDQAGTHTDPVTGDTVPNAGWYRWSVSPAGWRWVSDIPETEVVYASNAEVALGAEVGEAVSPANLLSAYGSGNNAPSLEFIDGMLVDDRYFPFHMASNSNRVTFSFDKTDQVYDMDIRSLKELAQAAAMDFTYSMSPGETIYPLVINSDYRVLLGIDIATGEVVGAGFESGGGGGSTSEFGDSMGYISGDDLRALGGPNGDRVLDDAATRTWLSAQTVGTGVRAIFQEGSYKHLVRVSFDTGVFYYEGEVTIWIGHGQSNAEGQATSTSVDAIVTTPRYGTRLLMPTPNIWVGIATTSGDSIELDPDDVTQFLPLVDTIAPSGSHGTVAISGAVRAEMAAAELETGWTPEMIAWTAAEGGQSIYNLLPSPGSGYYSFANETALLNKVVALLPTKKVVVRWIDMAHGEANSSLMTLGELHDDLREAYETMAQGETGQTDPVRMMSWQMSSFASLTASALSILTYALANESAFGNFWCAGPTYIFPWNPSDYLHQSSLGHLMRGEMSRVAIKSVEKTGYWRPLRMVSASITGANTITVTLSENAVIDTDWLTAAVANSGISVDDRTVTNVVVSGTTVTITTSEAAAGATTVRAAMNVQSDPRTAGNIPRSNIRSVASYGEFSADCGIHAGTSIYKPLSHQALTIS